MMLKLILLFFILKIFTKTAAASKKGTEIENTSAKVKEITVAIEQNSQDGDINSSSDSRRKSPSQRTRTNFLLNSKLIYPKGSRRGAAFNQGILKFQQLLDLPIDINATETRKIMEESIEDISKEIPKYNETIEHKGNCGGSSEEEKDTSSGLLKKKFIEDFGTASSTEVTTSKSKDEDNEMKTVNSSEEVTTMSMNKTQEAEKIDSVKPTNATAEKSSLELLDDENEVDSNNTMVGDKIGNQTSYSPSKDTSKKVVEPVEVKPQVVQEISLKPNRNNKSPKKSKQEEEDEISQNIKRDILLGNLNPFFKNPSTSSIRNTNSVFFDDDTKTRKSSNLVSSFNPFTINSFAVNTVETDAFRRPSFSRLRSRPSNTEASVETLPSIPLSDTGNDKSSFRLRNSARSSLRQENKKSKFSSRYKSRPSAVSSASFSITPSFMKNRATQSRVPISRNFPTASRPGPKPSDAASSSENVEVVKSVDYSLPEEVGKSLTKTGPAKFKRKAGFESNGYPEYEMQKSLFVDPLTVNLDMSRKTQDLFNPYLVNTQMRNSNSRYKIRPSLPDSKTRKIREFSTTFGNSYFQPSIQTKEMVDLYEKPGPPDEYEEQQEQPIKNFESDMIFKPYFVTQSPKMFQMPETTSFKYTTNEVHMVDLSNF